MKFPKQIFVTVQNDGDDEFLLANVDLVEIGADGDKVGIYELVEVKKKKITDELI